MKIIKKEDLTVRTWSGGTTTELAIYPQDAVYAERDFLWRLSTAEVLDETSTFTPLPDYHRFLTLRKGSLRLRHDDGEWYTLRPGEITEFDGGSLTVSEGRVTDFNLMLRKGRAGGTLCAARLPEKTGYTPLRELFPGLSDAAGAKAAGSITAVYLSEGGPVCIRCSEDESGQVIPEGGMALIFPEDSGCAAGADEASVHDRGICLSAGGDSLVICASVSADDAEAL